MLMVVAVSTPQALAKTKRSGVRGVVWVVWKTIRLICFLGFLRRNVSNASIPDVRINIA